MRTKTLLALGAALLTAPMLAQVRASSHHESGQGSINLSGNRDIRISECQLRLERDGTFSATLSGDEAVTFRGRWNTDGSRSVWLRVTDAFGSNASGSGSAEFTGGDALDYISLSGESRRGSYWAEFRSHANSGGGGSDATFRDVRGTGNAYFASTGNTSVNRVTVELRAGGEFRMQFWGNRNGSVYGRYSRSGDVCSVRITDAMGESDVQASGVVYLSSNGRQLHALNISGSINRRNFSIDFRSTSSGSGGNAFYANVSGYGSLRRGQNEVDVSRVAVALDTNRTGRITVTASTKIYYFECRWSRKNDSVIEITITDGFGYDGAEGRGEIRTNGRTNRFDHIAFSGRSAGMNYRVALQRN
jgi:hypothetical protein